ncbi:MAG: DUF4340 domain-containing protein [Deltaproteobacteria bacterium]|nr:DUF4340 domain-containing protein [Deltaproteobacteria bacterium]MBW2633663.1 DUF4340 domain-containing protein [Deltaproteobacteria bacterium]MBW2679037.1 DUF4340 domain-containing protein [Deltaproteobacteria bacterium]
MKIKKEYIILLVVIVALTVYLVSRNRDRNLYDLPQIESVDTKAITRIELTRAGAAILFDKEGSDWKIFPEKYLADPQKVKEMLAVMEGLTLTELISESKNYQRYDLDVTDGIGLKCWSKDALRFAFTIGKSAESNNHTFVKLPEDEAVYHARGNFRNKFDMPKGEFREKTVLFFDKTDIDTFAIRLDAGFETFKRVDVLQEPAEPEEKDNTSVEDGVAVRKWVDAGGGDVDDDQINGLVSTLSDLKCEKYLEGKTKDDFSEPVYTIKLKGAGTYTLSIYAEMEIENESYFPAFSSESAYPFLLTKWRAENIMKKPEDLHKNTGGA